MVSPLFVGSGAAPAQTLTPIAPNDASISTSDFCAVSVDANRIRFTRPIVDGQGFETANPGARVRFRTNATLIRVRLQYTNLVTRLDTYNGVGYVLVDGVYWQSFNRVQGAAGPASFLIGLPSTLLRTIEIVMPYCASVDFLGIDLPPGATLSAAAARPATRYVAIGDSITHGFVGSEVRQTWPTLLAASKGWQLINCGYGGRQCVASDGAVAAALAPTVATYLIGYNNFYPQVPLATFKTAYKSFLAQFRAAAPLVKLYCITPLYTPNTFGPLTIENYRQQIRDAITETGSALNILVEGLPLASNDATSFPDNVHPGDSGALQIANALSSVVNP